jgi:hypothetical protein
MRGAGGICRRGQQGAEELRCAIAGAAHARLVALVALRVGNGGKVVWCAGMYRQIFICLGFVWLFL